MEERLEILVQGSRHIGKECARCGEHFIENDEIVECPRCHKIHHVHCWKSKGGCARTGCPQVARTIIDDRPKGDGPLPGISPKYVFAGAGIALLIILLMTFWPKPPDPAAGRTRIVVLMESFLDEGQAFQTKIIEFNQSHPDLYIDLQTSPFSVLEQQLIARIAAGDAPDIFTLPYNRFESFVKLEALLPIGSEDVPYYGVHHPSAFRALGIFSKTVHPKSSHDVLHYLLTHLPSRDLTEQQQQLGIQTPAYLQDTLSFLDQ